jgi:sporulation protein YlmC with PRC-barrel domain
MKRIITTLALILAFGFSFVFANAYAGGGMSKDRFRSFETSKLIGTEVDNPSGESVGTIRNFVLDSNGHIDFVILSQDFYWEPSHGFYWEYISIPPQTVAVPFRAIKVEPNGKVAVLKFNKWKLSFPPEFVRSDLSNRKWAATVYKYYGLQPYWTEGRSTQRMSSTMNKPMSEQMMKPYTMREQKVEKYIWGYSPNSDSYMDSYHW